MKIIDELSFPIDTNDKQQMLNIVNSCIGTKFTMRFGSLIAVSRAEQPGRQAARQPVCCLEAWPGAGAGNCGQGTGG